MNIIIGDIDGCIINSEHRVHHYISGDIETYHSLWKHDVPMLPCIAIYRKFLTDSDYNFLFITGRNEANRKYTLWQLQTFVDSNIRNDQLLMRPTDLTANDMHDTELKPFLLRRAGYNTNEVFMAFDDRDSVVAMWRSLGITCLQPQLGPW